MSNPLAEYLSALEARDAREKAHEEYINACMCFPPERQQTSKDVTVRRGAKAYNMQIPSLPTAQQRSQSSRRLLQNNRRPPQAYPPSPSVQEHPKAK